MTSQNLKNSNFSPWLIKLYILLGDEFLIKNFGVNQCISAHRIYKIGYISAIFKDKYFWFRPRNSLKLCACLGCICDHMSRRQLFFRRKVPITLKQFLLDI